MAKALITLLLLTVVLTAVTSAQEEQRQPQNINDKQVQAITNYMNTTADPCKDFFAYACGNWSVHHNTTRYTEMTGLIDHKINKKFAIMLENYTPQSSDNSINDRRRRSTSADVEEATLNKFWTYYKSCKREKTFEMKRYLQLVRPAERLNWPILQAKGLAWPKERFNWFLTLAKLRRFGLKGIIVEHMVLPKNEDGNNYMIDLDQASAAKTLPKRLEVATLLHALGLSWKESFEKYRKMRLFHMKIFELLELEDEYGVLEVTVEDLQNDLPSIPWRKYLANVLDRNNIGDGFTLQIRNWQYFIELAKLLEETDPEVVCNYIMIMFLNYVSEDGPSEFEKIDCIVDARSKMEVAANYLYRQRFYRPEAARYEAEVRSMLDDLRRQFLKMIHLNRLRFSADEIEYLEQKLSAMRINFGNLPPRDLDEFVSGYYENVQLDQKNFYKNHFAMLELRFKKEHEQLENPISDEMYVYVTDSDTARSSTPYYLMRQNIIIVPYGILQPPMFHKNMHQVLKLSLFGFLLAHELAHGFDGSGVAYDHRGNLGGLGANMTEAEDFTNSVKCLERDETDSIDERIADVVGVRLAFDAYFARDDAEPTNKLAFSDFNERRLFFLNMAEFFCGSMGFAFMDHDSDNVRLQQTLLHFEPFAEEFACNVGDTMNPAEKCRLW